MAGEANKLLSTYQSILGAASVGAGGVSGESAAIGSVANSAYILLDFKVTVSAGTVNTGETVEIIRRASDGTTKQPAPDATYRQRSVQAVTLKAGGGAFYAYGVSNVDDGDTFYLFNNGLNALTLALEVRPRTSTTAP